MPNDKRDAAYAGAHHFDIALLGVSGRESPRQATGGAARGARPGPNYAPRVVLVERDGGSGGTSTTQCSFTYSIFGLWDTERTEAMAIELTPQKARAIIGIYTVAPDGSRGLAVSIDGVWLLLEAYEEVEFAGGCYQ